MKRFFTERKGSVQIVSLMIFIPVVLAVSITFLFLFPVFSTQFTLNAQAKEIAHVAEVTGRVGEEVDEEIARLQEATGVTADTIQWDTDWLDSTEGTMQLKTAFTVTLTKQVEIPIIKPVIGESGPVTVELNASAGGISEVYYKP